MTAKKKLAQKRLTLLQVAEKLRNVSEACCRQGVSRSQFYEYKRAFQEKGFDGLMDRPPIPKTFANETPPEVKEKVIKLSLEHPYQIFLDFTDIKHLRTKVATPRTNGFVERFNRTVLDEFFRETFRDKFYASVEELQKVLEQWLHYYNHERPHRGYRNMGKRPMETIEEGKAVKEQMTHKKAA